MFAYGGGGGRIHKRSTYAEIQNYDVKTVKYVIYV